MLTAHGATVAISDTDLTIYNSPLVASLTAPEVTIPISSITEYTVVKPTPFSLGSVTLKRGDGEPTTIRFQRTQQAALQLLVADIDRVRQGEAPLQADTPIPGLDFVAIDVETANADWGSIIEIGVTKVLGGIVADSKTWRCAPPPGLEEFLEDNIAIHGIHPEDVAEEPPFAERYELVKSFVGELPMVSHNAQFDFTALSRACAASNETAATNPFGCTLALSRSRSLGFTTHRLPDVCQGLGITLEHHHCAGDDAEACARIVTSLAGTDGFKGSFEEYIEQSGFTLGHIGTKGRIRSVQKIRHRRGGETEEQEPAPGNGWYRKRGRPAWSAVSTPETIPEPNEDANPEGLLYHQHVTLTGDFEPMDKGTLWQKIADLGGIIGKNVTKKTTLVVVGSWAKKTSKHKRAEQLQEQGQQIDIWPADKLFTVLGIEPEATEDEEPPF